MDEGQEPDSPVAAGGRARARLLGSKRKFSDALVETKASITRAMDYGDEFMTQHFNAAGSEDGLMRAIGLFRTDVKKMFTDLGAKVDGVKNDLDGVKNDLGFMRLKSAAESKNLSARLWNTRDLYKDAKIQKMFCEVTDPTLGLQIDHLIPGFPETLFGLKSMDEDGLHLILVALGVPADAGETLEVLLSKVRVAINLASFD